MMLSGHFKESIKENSLSERLIAGSFGIIIGVFFLLGVGFTNWNSIHDAAHDARHINSFPCH